MTNILTDEKIICSINVYKDIKKSSKVGNLVVNLLTGGIGGRVTNDYRLTLTEDNLYVDTIQYSPWGGLAETSNSDKISRNDIKLFVVKSEKSVEYIIIETNDFKEMTYIRDNEKKDDLALIMSALISKGIEE